MDLMLRILLRWMHIIPAAVVIGGAFFMTVLLPPALRLLEPDRRAAVAARIRRGFKITIHTCILLLLISGTINTVLQWQVYSSQPGLMHGLWGGHLILALAAMSIAVTLLLGRDALPSAGRWMRINLVILLIVAALASSLKQVRDRAISRPRPEVPAAPR